jgi:hypothetical protein
MHQDYGTFQLGSSEVGCLQTILVLPSKCDDFSSTHTILLSLGNILASA